MSRNENINNGIWDDPPFELLSADASLLYIWSWTNTRCGMAGIYKVSVRSMTQCKVVLEQIPDALKELADGHFAFYEDDVLWIRARVKRLGNRSPQIAKAVAKDLAQIRPEHVLRIRFLEEYGNAAWLKEALSEALRESIDTPSEKASGKGNPDAPSVPLRGVPLSETGSESKKSEDEGSGEKETSPLPEGFPAEIVPNLRSAFRVLRALAERRGSKAVRPESLASVVQARSHRPIVKAALDCAAHWDGLPNGPKDVVAAYRNWLDKTDDFAGYEPLDANGMPGGRVIRITDGAKPAARFSQFDQPQAAFQ